jgi:hypothetical protein
MDTIANHVRVASRTDMAHFKHPHTTCACPPSKSCTCVVIELRPLALRLLPKRDVSIEYELQSRPRSVWKTGTRRDKHMHCMRVVLTQPELDKNGRHLRIDLWVFRNGKVKVVKTRTYGETMDILCRFIRIANLGHLILSDVQCVMVKADFKFTDTIKLGRIHEAFKNTTTLEHERYNGMGVRFHTTCDSPILNSRKNQKKLPCICAFTSGCCFVCGHSTLQCYQIVNTWIKMLRDVDLLPSKSLRTCEELTPTRKRPRIDTVPPPPPPPPPL